MESPKAIEKAKASVRAFLEHDFGILKNIFRRSGRISSRRNW